MAKKVLILVADNFRDEELIYPYYRMQEAGFEVVLAGLGKKKYKGKFGVPIEVDKDVSDCRPGVFAALIIPGGLAPDKLRMSKEVLKIVRIMHGNGKIIAAICHAGWVLASAGIVSGKKVTSYEAIKDDMINAGANWVDKEVVVDGNLITSRKPEDLPDFCREILNQLKGPAH